MRLGGICSFGEDSCGHVYAASISGTVARLHEGPIEPCPEQAPPDTQAPGLSVTRAKAQRLLARGAVYVDAVCDELCGLSVESNVRLRVRSRTKKWAFPAVAASAPAGATRRLKLRLTKATKRGIGAAVARGERPLVKALVRARDAAGNEARRTVYVRVVR